MSLINMEKRVGPHIEPWGTPEGTLGPREMVVWSYTVYPVGDIQKPS